MVSRLIWNFEIKTSSLIDFHNLPVDNPDGLRWERRYFWPEHKIIKIYGLDSNFFDVCSYRVKQRQDLYYLVANSHYNVKRRGHELLYKPLLREAFSCRGFGKKINLLISQDEQLLPGNKPIDVKALRALIRTDSQQILVKKAALIHKFNCTPAIKLELARLQIDKQSYFSACVEGRSQKLVNLISKQLFHKQSSSDYVHFLQKHILSQKN